MSGFGTIISGVPEYQQVMNNANYLRGPDGNSYQAGNNALKAMGGPVAGQADQAAATGLIAQTAAGKGPSLANATMQTGLTNTNNAIHAQSMSNMGNTGSGISQRNMLNAQAAANSNYVNAAGQASVAEQMGAQSNYANAANAQTQSSLGARQQQLGAYGLQNQANMAYDQAARDTATAKANIGLQATNSDAKQVGAIGQFAGNTIGGLAMLSDERCKQLEADGKAAGSKVSQFLEGYNGGQQAASQPAPAAPSSGPVSIAPGQGILQAGGMAQDGAPTGLAASGGQQMQNMGHSMQHIKSLATAAPQAPGGMEMAANSGVNMGAIPGAQHSMGYAQPMAMMGMPRVPSDERCKEQMGQPTNRQLSGFMGAMEPSTFQYKDQSYSPGTHLGVMAQDVDNSKIGDNMVEDQGGLKQINVPKALGASLASLAYLNERIDKLEGKKKNDRTATA